MSFALTPAAPFTNLITVVDATWLNFVRASLPNAIDAVGGGTYALIGGNTWTMSSGGGNIVFDANFTASAIVSATFTAASTVSSLSQAWTFGTDSITTFQGTAGHEAVLATGTHFTATLSTGGQFFDQSAWTKLAGSTTHFQGTATFDGDSTTSVQGSSGHNALWSYGAFSAIVDSGAWTHSGGHTITAANWVWTNGCGVIGSAGSTWNINGSAAHNTNFNITGDGSGGSCAVVLTAGARITTDTSSNISLLGPLIRVGSSAVNVERAETGTAPTISTNPFDPSTADTWLIPTGHAAIVTLTLGMPSTGPHTVTFYSPDQSLMSHDYIITLLGGGGAPAFTFNQANVKVASVTLKWTGARWIIVGVAGSGYATVDDPPVWG